MKVVLDVYEGNQEFPFNDNTSEDSDVSAANTNSKEDLADADMSAWRHFGYRAR